MDWWPLILLIVLGVLTLAGVVCIVLIYTFWQAVGQRVSDLWPKIVTKLIQVPAGAVSLCGAYAAANKQEWLPAAVAGALCVVVWEIVQHLIDNRVKLVDKFNKAELARALREGKFRTRLLSVLRTLVDRKARRLQKVVQPRTGRPSVAAARKALTPKPHFDEVLERLAIFLREQLSPGEGDGCNIRVGLYVEADGVLIPRHGVDLNNPEYSPFRSYREHPDFYRLTAEGQKALVVQCVRERRTVIVDDCVEAAKRGGFNFSGEPQRRYLRSMVAVYLGEVCAEDGTMRKAALAVDADAPGVFRESDRDSLESCLREFGVRLRLELLLSVLLGERRVQS
jgi:hypothetical protein